MKRKRSNWILPASSIGAKTATRTVGTASKLKISVTPSALSTV